MQVDTLILGAGAAGLMAAAHAGGRVLVVDHAKAPGEKIRISGGGRCNFTNLHASPANFLSRNPHFCKSALKRYTQWDFLDLVARHGIAWHEKTLGQLFCDGSAKEIVAMLLAEMKAAGADLWLSTAVLSVARDDAGFAVTLEREGRQVVVRAAHLIVATGGKSIPKMGATGLAYDIARQFGHALTDIRPALVPLTFQPDRFAPLAGVALPVTAACHATSFAEAMLFTHRGLSGPAILQISSYWVEGESIRVNLMPGADPYALLRAQRQESGRRQMQTVLAQMLPGRLADHLATDWALTGNLADQNDVKLRALADRLTGWELTPTGSEGYRTAEVTLGGVDTDGLSSQSMMSKTVPDLYFIGEAVDVTGWLGGYNFQWAWSSGVAAGRDIAARG
ncbi:NAD(P)/FAD-dependent oxidoreductase [Seohaeicola sp. SP36]|uniref:NAD(P)/FAD-dependent oxidoreductase n=1 Tax=unclassified Seohaeicola TaxID=2641111 RepID=UPI00237A9919|nr:MULTISPECIES: NAD(P)/FAD-dependent oxidoreductase [unclassified Seohaeicola]MDD9707574.1 NAD(P)/FAD-dependent oxidoreductase [Seohaeicola sp. 4SK31]MDD9735815.1 NAD(P)/FAD-dependent oxidoreductase [Seohaeicola sp. SP36]